MPNYQELFEYPCFSQVSCYPIDLSLHPGFYRFELWGGSGGDSGSGFGGRGAYVSGTISLIHKTDFFLFIGSSGHLLPAQTSFNGGGRAHIGQEASSKGGSGGGGTDIRLYNDSNSEGFLSRIIVAGGGGGGESYLTGVQGGNGGSYSGQKGFFVIDPAYTQGTISVPIGGNQTHGGYKGYCTSDPSGSCNIDYDGTSGIFGHGGNGSNYHFGGGGGGGYFGGGGGTVSNSIVSSGAGGSSYISGHHGCQSFQSNPDDSSSQPNGPIHHSGLIFTNTIFKGGNESFFSPHDTIETGHSGNGAIKITFLGFIDISCKHYSYYSIVSFVVILFFTNKI